MARIVSARPASQARTASSSAGVTLIRTDLLYGLPCIMFGDAPAEACVFKIDGIYWRHSRSNRDEMAERGPATGAERLHAHTQLSWSGVGRLKLVDDSPLSCLSHQDYYRLIHDPYWDDDLRALFPPKRAQFFPPSAI